jgi:hypothetical protein
MRRRIEFAAGAPNSGGAREDRLGRYRLPRQTMVKAFLSELGHAVEDFGQSNKPFDYPLRFHCRCAPKCGGRTLLRRQRVSPPTGKGICRQLTTNGPPSQREYFVSARRSGRRPHAAPVEVWLKTPYEGGRHDRRVEKIAEIEAKERLGPGPSEGSR